MQQKATKILFITLKTFSLTGGVEKVCRGMAYALQQMHDAKEVRFKMLSLYDDTCDERYVKAKNFKGYQGKRGKGMLSAIKKGISYDTVILSHINLAPIGLAIKLASPSTRIILWSHGIEIWRAINPVKKVLLTRCDDIVAVSRFTASEIERLHDTGGKRVKVLANGLDPYFEVPDLQTSNAEKFVQALKQKYQIAKGKKVFMALTRLKSSEKNKNYDRVIRLLGELKQEGKEACYVLCGKYDEEEYSRIRAVAAATGMAEHVILTGFVPDEELRHYYQMADAFVLPSTKEGFGLAFIEAQACGVPVLAGNRDGSTEAVQPRESGILVNPEDEQELKAALETLYLQNSRKENRIEIQKQCLKRFSYSAYRDRLHALLQQN